MSEGSTSGGPLVKQPPPFSIPLVAIFFCQGFGMLFPWNALLSSANFISQSVGTKAVAEPLNYCTLFYFLLNLAAMVGMFFIKSVRLEFFLAIASFCVYCLAYVFLLLFTNFSGSETGVPALVCFAFASALCGLSTAVVQSHFFAMSSKCHPLCSTMMLLGQAVAGLVACGSAWLLKNSEYESKSEANFFYAICLFVMIFCFCVYFPLRGLLDLPILADSFKARARGVPDLTEPDDSPGSQECERTLKNANQLSAFQVFKHVWPLSVTLFLTFTVSLIVFPNTTGNLPYTKDRGDPKNKEKQLSFIASLILFNLFDALGRFVPSLLARVRSRFAGKPVKWGNIMILLVSLAVCRILFLIVFPFCEFREELVKKSSIPNLFKGKSMPIFLNCLLGLTTGSLATAAFVQAPNCPIRVGSGDTRPMKPAEQELSGRIMTLSTLLGLICGVAISFGYPSIWQDIS